jgi:hypothetical protein
VQRRRRHPRSCRLCGASHFDGVHISATGLCPDCGDRREVANHRQLKEHRGPFFDYWRLRSLAALGDLRELLDSAPPADDTPG